jgi:hypothetical protein
MTHRVAPQEFHVLADRYVIRTRVPKESITDDMIALRVSHANLAPGDAVTVQVMNHGYDTLLHEAEYRVVSRTESMERVNIDERNERMALNTTFRIARKGEWWSPVQPKRAKEAA